MPLCFVRDVRSAVTNDRDVRHQSLHRHSETRLSDSSGNILTYKKLKYEFDFH